LQSLEVYKGTGKQINSGAPYDGMDSKAAGQLIFEKMVAEGKAEEKVNYKIRDWLISRQRYWGAPIPIVHCPKDGAVTVPEDQLPVKLPDLETFEPSGDGRSPLARVPEFVNTTCPTCGGPAERETDTMDGFACSSWYFLRFADPHNNDKPFDTDKVKNWLPVDDYIGGAEHAVMHLLYARMWTKVMQDAGMIEFGEPFKTLRNHGMILAPDGAKMSKSKGNTIEPGILIDQGYGADAIRIMELFIGPWNQAANWSVEGMGGAFRFLQRIWTVSQDYMGRGDNMETADDIELKRTIHRAIQRVTKDLEDMGFNTAIAGLMETVNELYKLKTTLRFEQAPETWAWAINTLLQLLSPFAPHIAEELWAQLGNEGSIHQSTWPTSDEQYLVSDTMTVVVQVNGKLRAQLEVASDATKEQILDAAQQDTRVAEYLQSSEPKKTIYVPGKLVNFVI
jgi:leucyl-tRNA synthetase